jgi:hypothetical protein
MHLRCVLALALLLAGCTDADWSGIMPTAPVGNLAADPGATPVSSGNNISIKAEGNCRGAAQTRAGDADAQGYDSDVQRDVYEKTYADCLYWAKRNGR